MTKIIYKIALIFAFVSIIASCGKDFLEEEPRSFLNPETTYTSDAGLAAGSVGLYDEMSMPFFDSGLMRDYMALLNAGTDFMRTGIQRSREEIVELNDEYTAAGNNGNLLELWSHYYRLANNATQILESSNIHSWQNEALQKQTEAEALFFRAWAHLWLTLHWGNVPLIREATKTARVDYGKTSQEEILEFVVEDLLAAVARAPEQSPESGRIDRATANHLLAYTYLAQKNWAQAEASASQAVNAPNHRLVTERFGSRAGETYGNVYWDLFQLNNHNENPEGLLVLQNGNGDLSPQYLPALTSSPALRFVRILQSRIELVPGIRSGPEYGGRGYARFSPTLSYYDLFETEDIRAQMPIMRKYFTALEDATLNDVPVSVGDTLFDFDNPSNGIITDVNDLRVRPYFTKWLKESNPSDTTKYLENEVAYTGGTIRDHYIIRLAETYLILAEAQHMQGKNAEAAANINLIRQRSGASPITAAEVSIDFILDEKARELYGEQYSRKADLFRTGKYIERVKLYNPEAGLNVKAKHTLLPIPQSEINLNSGNQLEQNPGW